MAPVLGIYNGWKALLGNSLYSKEYRLNYIKRGGCFWTVFNKCNKSKKPDVIKTRSCNPVHVVLDVLQQHQDSMGIWMNHAEDILYHSNMFCCCFFMKKKMQQANRGTTDKVTKNAWQKKSGSVKRLGYTTDCPWNLRGIISFTQLLLQSCKTKYEVMPVFVQCFTFFLFLMSTIKNPFLICIASSPLCISGGQEEICETTIRTNKWH